MNLVQNQTAGWECRLRDVEAKVLVMGSAEGAPKSEEEKIYWENLHTRLIALQTELEWARAHPAQSSVQNGEDADDTPPPPSKVTPTNTEEGWDDFENDFVGEEEFFRNPPRGLHFFFARGSGKQIAWIWEVKGRGQGR